MEKTKKIVLLLFAVAVVIAGLIIIGRGKQAVAPQTANVPTKDSLVKPVASQQSPAEANVQKPVNLEPLPADDKAAIDTELTKIDKDLKDTDNLINSADLSNANLGL